MNSREGLELGSRSELEGAPGTGTGHPALPAPAAPWPPLPVFSPPWADQSRLSAPGTAGAKLPARAAVGRREPWRKGTMEEHSMPASWNSCQRCSTHQENWTRLVLAQIQSKVKCCTDCNSMCISHIFIWRDAGPRHLQVNPPQCRLELALLHSCVKLLSVASQHSYKEITAGQHTVL